jgi:predicted phosphodiesterase
LYGVRFSVAKLFKRAKELKADFALFAHTHSKYEEEREGVTLLNPSNRCYIIIPEDGKYDFFNF